MLDAAKVSYGPTSAHWEIILALTSIYQELPYHADNLSDFTRDVSAINYYQRIFVHTFFLCETSLKCTVCQ